MDEPYPVEILTPIAAGPGSLTLDLFELFGSGGKASKAWDRLGVSTGSLASPFGSTTQNNASEFIQGINNGSSGSGPFAGAVDIVDIFIRQAQLDPSQTQVVKYIRPLATGAASSAQPYAEQYVGCVITNVIDGEEIQIGTLEVIKRIQITYRYVMRNGNPSAAFKVRDAAL